MQVDTFPLQGLLKLTPKKFGDARGFFSETYNAETFAAAGLDRLCVTRHDPIARHNSQ